MRGAADISVVIPTFDRTDLLRQTVESVLGQTRRVREILVVDNGVGDAATCTLAPFGDAVVHLRAPPRGKQVARNVGLTRAASTWVALLDDDDLLRPDYVERVERAIAIGASDIIGTDHRKFRVDGDQRRTNMELAPPGYWEGLSFVEADGTRMFHGRFPLDRLLRRVPFYPSMTVVRRAFALAIGGYDARMNGIMSEDLEFLVRALARGRVTLIFEPLVRYRVHPGNATADRDGRMFGRWRIFEFVRATHGDLPGYFVDALDRDLPIRRCAVFDRSARGGHRAVARAVAPMLRRQDWTPRRRLHHALCHAPPIVKRSARWIGRLIAPRRPPPNS